MAPARILSRSAENVPAHLRGRTIEPPLHAPNAALLIDFDNVTLGIRSDLAKELRTLLNSDIIKGKVAVSRAYADWRRYPQYIVPLSESSIDLIFAPAFGTAKKNATDIRLAVDAMELVFTRPEIGTFILLSGDSDFSTLVIKLKEYGKYVIGVGIRESASDLLIQNCDEYYSYSDLAGLTKETEVPSTQRDPWELVREAIAQMARNGDVMRSDRLKQVMQQLDPNFDERNAGFNRFSKFVAEAGNRGLLKVSKLDNGQYEVAPAGAVAAAAPAAEPEREAEGEERGEREGRRGRRRGRGRDRERGERGERGERAERPEGGRAEERPAAAAAAQGLPLARAFGLMRDALAQLEPPVPHEKLRLRMAALLGKDDPLLAPDRFPRLLRQANDAEVADVRKVSDDEYEVSLHVTEDPRARLGAPVRPAAGGAPAAPVPMVGVVELEEEPAPAAASTAADALRFGGRMRRGVRGPARPAEVPLVGVIHLDEEPAVEAAPAEPAEAGKPKSRRGGRGRGKAAKAEAAPTEAAEEKPTRKKSSRGRAKKKAASAE